MSSRPILAAAPSPVQEVVKVRLPRPRDRLSEEIIFGFVGPIGSGCSTAAKRLGKILSEKYNYEVLPLKLSELIARASIEELGLDPLPGDIKPLERVRQLQNRGNKLREKLGSDFVAARAVEAIHEERTANGYETAPSGNKLAKKRRIVHLIDSIKNPAELELLREVYGDVFWLVGVFAPHDLRKQRLQQQWNATGADIEQLMERDLKESEEHGQDVSDTFHQSDFFLRNDKDVIDGVDSALNRFLELATGSAIHSPTRVESAMYAAHSEAARSSCLSRQVGAAVVDERGELIGLGRNDVPRFQGGLYGPEDNTNDFRCFRWGGNKCHNDDQKAQIHQELQERVIGALRDAGIQLNDDAQRGLTASLKRSRVKGLIEFSRAVHAEMEAIISVARNGKGGLRGAHMYVTTYPCHSCARHILASGIAAVHYIEPYPKSLAMRLHADAVSEQDNELGTKLVFLQYHGVAPKNYLRLFKSRRDRKDSSGRLLERDHKTGSPIVTEPLDDYSTHEEMIVSQYAKAKPDEEASK